jgi:hypothetical protein
MLRAKIIPSKDGFSLLSINPRLALMYRALKRPGKGGRRDRIQCAYFGFESEDKAKAFIASVNQKFPGLYPQLREPERLSEVAFEVKLREFPGLLALVLKCAAKHESQPQQQEVGDAIAA